DRNVGRRRRHGGPFRLVDRRRHGLAVGLLLGHRRRHGGRHRRRGRPPLQPPRSGPAPQYYPPHPGPGLRHLRHARPPPPHGNPPTAGKLPGAIGGITTNNGAAAATLTANIIGTNTTFAGSIRDGTSQLGLTAAGQIGRTFTLTGNNTYTGATTILGGTTLQIGNGGTTGSIVNNVTVNSGGGVLAFNRSDSSTYRGPPTGGGLVTVTGGGTLTLSGTNTNTGGITVTGGSTLSVSADNNLGNAAGGLTFNDGTLQFGASFNLSNTRAITLNAGGGTIDTNGF